VQGIELNMDGIRFCSLPYLTWNLHEGEFVKLREEVRVTEFKKVDYQPIYLV